MKVLGIRYCSVSREVAPLVEFFGTGLGLPRMNLEGTDAEAFEGAIFTAGDSWLEFWGESEGMPAGVMLQIIVDDAEAMAEHARANGVEVSGPMDAHGERIFFTTAPNGLAISFQSKLEEGK